MGVKSLWKLLAPVGRPVMLETMEGQIMAIDSSIWIYQFQATMRDNDGKALSNAHVLGFLRRIAKLLFYGIKPVFVFDGGAPALKRNTLNERKRKKSGAATSLTRVAEKLLAAQLRRAAVDQAKGPQKSAKSKGKAPSGPVVLDDNTVYLEDIDSSMPKASPPKPTDTASASPSKPKFHDHDPYRLPDIDLEAAVAKATRAPVPDPRLATEDELRDFIEDMRPEDFDVTSPAFRELPTEVQYEIVGDLRLKSRQTSYARLQNMLRSAPTPLDFSKQQILNLQQRNTLTQQLLITTDSIGKAHLTIPVRVASERNREYVLVKNEGKDGGWILGVRDDGGTREKPIEIDQDDKKDVSEDGSDEDMDMEEVPMSVYFLMPYRNANSAIPRPSTGMPDPDLQEFQRSMNLAAIASRHAKKPPLPRKIAALVAAAPASVSQPLFDFGNDINDDDEDDGELALAIQQSIEHDKGDRVVSVVDEEDDGELALVIQESIDQAKGQAPARPRQPVQVNAVASSSKLVGAPATPRRPSSESVSASRSHYSHYAEDAFVRGTRLETALSIANAGLVRTPTKPKPAPTLKPPVRAPCSGSRCCSRQRPPRLRRQEYRLHLHLCDLQTPCLTLRTIRILPGRWAPSLPATAQIVVPSHHVSDDEVDMEEVLPSPEPPSVASSAHPKLTEQDDVSSSFTPPRANSPLSSFVIPDNDSFLVGKPLSVSVAEKPPFVVVPEEVKSTAHSDPQPIVDGGSAVPQDSAPVPPQFFSRTNLEEDDEHLSGWSRSPSPVVGIDQPQPRAPSPVPETWDAAQEMDPAAEESEFVQFMSQVKGKDLDEVQQEIDDEIKVLNAQKKAAMRDSEDINQQMINQIMTLLSLFGIPYITAPMEAEAQCAELVHLGLVNGVITDDSDVFLFGSQRVFKNMFNQSKTVECFLLPDLSRELGLDRDTLIRLAYLLGSDYVDGLPGVGPVVAMELLDEFPGEDGLHKFKDWWTKVQSGKDKPEDNKSKFRKRFKKKFKDLYLPPEWPNATVRDAYYHPTVDSSEEPFKWGLPDLDALREFLYVELSWSPVKVDELLLPIIQKIRKRGQSGALNKQGDLNGYFDIAGSGTVAPRQRQAYASKRLQQVVSDFRKKRKHSSKSPAAPDTPDGNSQSEDDSDVPTTKKVKVGKAKTGTATKRGTGRSRGRGAKKGSSRKKVASEDEAEFEGDAVGSESGPAQAAKLRPRPKPAYKGVAVDAEFVDED
ncbi:PIN domain-like protein [Mycena venus]|uniref:PIN domain-like protein n=1 Tax=Mycena venus TaxID=2733690 RepID=A0A8H6X8S6_9AGAR|nr:PIN domain-like protein [Mycena venus]